jgi:hypothetical protein
LASLAVFAQLLGEKQVTIFSDLGWPVPMTNKKFR